MNLDGYIRVSRVGPRKGKSFISPRVQREKIETFAKLHEHRIIEWHEELDEPGSRNDRPKFQAALARVEARETDGIAVAKLDRFARSVADAAGAIRRIEKAGGQLVSVEDNFDSSTPMGKFAMHMLLALGELELDRIRENWAAAQAYAVEESGVHIASRPPTGYMRPIDPATRKPVKRSRLEKTPRDADAVRDVFLARAGGSSWRELADLLTKRGVIGPYGNPQWTTSAVAKLVANPVYTGEARSGEHRKKNAHPAIVTSREWAAAQGARSASVPRSTEGALLSGLLRCGGCRYVLKPDTMNGRDGEKLRIYRCRGEHAAGRCPAPAVVMGRVIEPHVERVFLEALGPEGFLARSSQDDREVEQARVASDEADAELEAWIDLSVTALGKAVYLEGLEKRQQRADDAREALQTALAAASGPLADLPSSIDLAALWPSLGTAEKRRLLASGIDAIILFAGRHESIRDRSLVLFRGEAPADLPSRGRRVPLESFPRERPVAAGESAAEDLEEGAADGSAGRKRHRARTAA